jgi:hypothetical protein
MPLLKLHNSLQQLPLFQGMSNADLTNIIEHTKFGFVKVLKGKTVLEENDACTNFVFLLNGTLHVQSASDDHSYKVIETLNAPAVLQPERLFGLTPRYASTFIAVSDVNLMTLDKNEAVFLTNKFIIFRINLFNLFTTQTQKMMRQAWHKRPTDTRQRIIRFIENRCLRPAGDKEIQIHMETLADEINEGRLNVSKTLNMMDDEGLIKLHRGGIYIPALEKLLM